MSKKRKIKALKKLIQHAWIHAGYPHCGYGQMTTEQKKLYCKVVGVSYDTFNKEFFEARVRAMNEKPVYGVHPDGRRVFPLLEHDRKAGFVEVGAPTRRRPGSSPTSSTRRSGGEAERPRSASQPQVTRRPGQGRVRDEERPQERSRRRRVTR
jgi:hypothetical protein